ncbi:MAG: RIP metalloprotease RseP [Eubacteriales bacterium]
MTFILFVLVFGIIVLAHELGHFLLAKANGIQVNEFAIGMGPKLVHFKKGDTEYAIRLLPIGGACVFEGEDGLNAEEGKLAEGAFPNASVWARISTVVAGPLFNFILAFIFAIIIVGYTGSDIPTINGIIDGYPAQEAGMQAGDVVKEMNGTKVYLAREIYIYTYINQGEHMELVYERDGELFETTVIPKYSEEEGRYLIGFEGYGTYLEASEINVLQYSYYEVRYSVVTTIKSLGMLLAGDASTDDLSGPVGIAQVIGEVSEQAAPYGMWVLMLNMMNIALLLSVNLGIINLLPLPALDGGRLVFLLVEAVRGKPVPADKEGMVHLAGFIALMMLMVFVMYNDIMRLFA